MSEIEYPYGYGTSTATLQELEARYGPTAPIPPHPAFWRRLKAFLVSREGTIGIGGAYRFVQPQKPGFAPPGMSFHEKQRFASGFAGYSAADLVVKNGDKVHRSPYWSEVPRQGTEDPDIEAFGLHMNISNEPWHIQCVEMDGYQSWVNAGRKDPDVSFVPAGNTEPEPPQVPVTGLPVGSRTLRLTRPRTKGLDVLWVQNVLRGEGLTLSADGIYGPQTEDRVEICQRWNNIEDDGIVGPVTWSVLFQY